MNGNQRGECEINISVNSRGEVVYQSVLAHAGIDDAMQERLHRCIEDHIVPAVWESYDAES